MHAEVCNFSRTVRQNKTTQGCSIKTRLPCCWKHFLWLNPLYFPTQNEWNFSSSCIFVACVKRNAGASLFLLSPVSVLHLLCAPLTPLYLRTALAIWYLSLWNNCWRFISTRQLLCFVSATPSWPMSPWHTAWHISGHLEDDCKLK